MSGGARIIKYNAHILVVDGSACSKLSNTDSHLLGLIPNRRTIILVIKRQSYVLNFVNSRVGQ